VQKWSYCFICWPSTLEGAPKIRHHSIYSVKFTAKNKRAARLRILELYKTSIRRLKTCKGRFPQIQAGRCIGDTNDIDSKTLVRIRHRYSNRRVLRVKEPDKAFVYGYGAEAVEELSK
jgi:hypothetical protein